MPNDTQSCLRLISQHSIRESGRGWHRDVLHDIESRLSEDTNFPCLFSRNAFGREVFCASFLWKAIPAPTFSTWSTSLVDYVELSPETGMALAQQSSRSSTHARRVGRSRRGEHRRRQTSRDGGQHLFGQPCIASSSRHCGRPASASCRRRMLLRRCCSPRSTARMFGFTSIGPFWSRGLSQRTTTCRAGCSLLSFDRSVPRPHLHVFSVSRWRSFIR